jgi:hypothetical protein
VIETPDANLSKGMRQLNGVSVSGALPRHPSGEGRVSAGAGALCGAQSGVCALENGTALFSCLLARLP